jgi:hypothetical protein
LQTTSAALADTSVAAAVGEASQGETAKKKKKRRKKKTTLSKGMEKGSEDETPSSMDVPFLPTHLATPQDEVLTATEAAEEPTPTVKRPAIKEKEEEEEEEEGMADSSSSEEESSISKEPQPSGHEMAEESSSDDEEEEESSDDEAATAAKAKTIALMSQPNFLSNLLAKKAGIVPPSKDQGIAPPAAATPADKASQPWRAPARAYKVPTLEKIVRVMIAELVNHERAQSGLKPTMKPYHHGPRPDWWPFESFDTDYLKAASKVKLVYSKAREVLAAIHGVELDKEA